MTTLTLSADHHIHSRTLKRAVFPPGCQILQFLKAGSLKTSTGSKLFGSVSVIKAPKSPSRTHFNSSTSASVAMKALGEDSQTENEFRFKFAILGDLHLEPGQMDTFHRARDQIVEELSDGQGGIAPNTFLFQLGDVGGYKHKPGSRPCFKNAVQFLDSFHVPRLSVLGNHDLEGEEFDTDVANLAAWSQVFGQPHYWVQEFGPIVCIGLSTVRFRDAIDSCHEVFVDEAQVAWFEDTLKQYRDRQVFVFSHAPPMGSGLTSLQRVHVRNRCAWLNQSGSNPQRFIKIVQRSPQIKLWFSGHYHLSHDYEKSVSKIASCLFVQTGVMGECDRDGRRHSRILQGDSHGYQLFTFDHRTASRRLDARHVFGAKGNGSHGSTELFSNNSADRSCTGGGSFCPDVPSSTETPSDVQWWIEDDVIFALNDNQLVQYCPETKAPLGIVVDAVNGRSVSVVKSADGRVDRIELLETPESVAMSGKVGGAPLKTGSEVVTRNASGGFWKIFQVNKWRLRRERAALEATLSALAGSVPKLF